MAKKKKTPKTSVEAYLIDFINYKLYVVRSSDPVTYRNTDFVKAWPKFGTDPSTDWVAVHLSDDHYPRHSFIILPSKVENSIILHELTHVVDRIIDYFGFEGTEIRAYMLEYLYKQVTKTK